MGRHSAPDDADEGADLAEAGVDADAGGSGVTVAERDPGRHARDGEATDGDAADGDAADGDAGDGLSFLDDAFDEGAPDPQQDPTAEPGVAIPEHDAPTSKIALADIARHDRALPEETTAKIAPVTDATVAEDPAPDATTAGAAAALATAAHPRPQPAPPAAEAGEAVGSGPDDAKSGAPRPGAHATRHDLALVKNHGDVRARAIAAIVVPFAVYVVVLVIMGALTVHNLIWIWAPAVAAGVLVGLVLDAGHRRYPTPTGPAEVTAPEGPA